MDDDHMAASLWGRIELEFHGPTDGNPFLDVEFSATFRNGDTNLVVPGFYDGDGVFRLRFLPNATGLWRYETSSSAAALNGQTGAVEVGAAKPGDHGPVVADGLHFRYADGARYINIGTTAYAWNHQEQALQEQTLASLSQAPFTKIRMCVFPKHYRYNETEPDHYPFKLVKKGQSTWPATQEEAGWEFDFDEFNPAFFQHLEKRISQLAEIGVEADLILMHPYDRWGFDHMSPEQDDRYLKYVVARLASYSNVWWSMANEYDLMPNKTLEDWDRFIRIVRENDPYGHLLSVHNCLEFYDYKDPKISHCSIQHEYPRMSSVWRLEFEKPVSVDECCYEGDVGEAWGNISGAEMTHRFWSGVVNGGYVTHGEAYRNDTDTIWWGKGGKLIGDSVPRIAFLREVLEEAPGGLDPISATISHRLTVAGDRRNLTFSELIGPDPEHLDWSPKVVPGFDVAAVPHQFYLVYFGPAQPSEFQVPVPPEETYSATLLDTWDMTRTPLSDRVSRGDILKISPKPHQALILKRI